MKSTGSHFFQHVSRLRYCPHNRIEIVRTVIHTPTTRVRVPLMLCCVINYPSVDDGVYTHWLSRRRCRHGALTCSARTSASVHYLRHIDTATVAACNDLTNTRFPLLTAPPPLPPALPFPHLNFSARFDALRCASETNNHL